MTPFQQYAHERWTREFPQWTHRREDLDAGGECGVIEIRYVIPSPTNSDNLLYVLFTPHDITVKFAILGAHEHYDPDFYDHTDGEMAEAERWNEAYSDAINEYVLPVVQNRLFALQYANGEALTHDVYRFAEINGIINYHWETWSAASGRITKSGT